MTQPHINNKPTAWEWPGRFLAGGAHAQQDIPSQHRLLNAGGMALGWITLNKLRHIVFGVKMKAEGEYVDVPIEDVPAPLRFLHKAIDWQPHSDAPEHQWKKIAYQLFPGIGAGLGATAGSLYAFERNGRSQTFKDLKGLQKLNLFDADFVAQFSQSKALRALAAFFGTFSAASGLTFFYGMTLTNAFAAANGGRVFTGDLARGSFAPHRAITAQLDKVGQYVGEALKSGKMDDALANDLYRQVVEPLFGHQLATPEAQQSVVKTLQKLVDRSFAKFQKSGKKPNEIAEAVTKELTDILGKKGIDQTAVKELGLNLKAAAPGNANPILYAFQHFLESVGIVKPAPAMANFTPKLPVAPTLPLAGALAVAGGLATAKAAEPPAIHHSTAQPPAPGKHSAPETTGKSAAEYVYESAAMHQDAHRNEGKTPPAIVKWLGNAQLAVIPWNRVYCATGLTAGLMVGGNMAKIATGYGLDGKTLEKSKVPTYLQWMHKVVKDYNGPNGVRPRDRWIKYAQFAAYSLGGFLGIKIGTDMAYKGVHEKNKNPHYLEDYLPRVSMHQGDNWSWLSSFGGMFASSAGLFYLPIPGLNYGLSLAGRTTSMQDRNFMISGLNKYMSGAETTSFLRLREGSNYLCHYAVNNPDSTPAQIEYMAFTMLAPLFKDKLTAEHIQKFTEAVHKVRDLYWEEGGIPKAKRKEALTHMREVFTGAGQEVLLMDMGLNPGTIDFIALNGLTGKIGNIGHEATIRKEQKNYQDALLGRLPKYVEEGLLTEARADWVKAGIEAMRRGATPPALPEEPEAKPIDIPPRERAFAKQVKPKKDYLAPLLDKSAQKGNWADTAMLDRSTSEQGAVVSVE